VRDGTEVLDARLGRLIEFDARSKYFPITATIDTKKPRANYWRCKIRLNQLQEGMCHTAETEVLTNCGWIRFENLENYHLLGTINPKSHKLEFQKPSAIQVLPYTGPVIISKNSRIQFEVTPNHRMYLQKWDEAARTLNDSYQFIQAKDIGWYAGLLGAPTGFDGIKLGVTQIGNKLINGDDLILFIGLFLAEGCLYYAKNGNYRIEIASGQSQKDPRGPEVRKKIISALGFNVCVYSDRFTIYSKSLFEFLKECYQKGALTKKIPNWLKNVSVEQLKLLIHGFFLGDGHETQKGRIYLYTSSSMLADDLQEVYLRLGLRSKKVSRKPRDIYINGKFIPKENCSTAYVINPWTKNNLSLNRKKHITEKYYSGTVYCATVPNGILITRLKGTILISGNCVGAGITHELAARPSEVSGLTYDFARNLYWEAQKIDQWPGGAYPGAKPRYEGTSVLAGLKVTQEMGYFDNYRWAFKLQDLILGVGYNGPAVMGTVWYEGMTDPDVDGMIRPTGRIAGGHCYLIDQVIPKKRLFGGLNSWGPSWGVEGRFYISFDDMEMLLRNDGEAAFILGRRSYPRKRC
jgi:hypothetical protein